MMPFLRVLAFEVSYHARRASTHVYFGIFFVLSAILMLAMGHGLIDVIGAAGGRVGWANSPFSVGQVTPIFSLFGLLITAPLLGRAVQRDFAYRMHPLVFSQPIGRHAFLAGRFVGGILANAYVLAAVPLGMLFTSLLPMMQPEHVGPFRLSAFGMPYLVVMLPNLLFTGALFFVLAANTRRMLANYVGGVAFLAAYTVAVGRIANVEKLVPAALLDPFGLITLEVITRYWTVVEQHTRGFPVSGLMLLNRFVWLAFGAAVLALGWWRFRFVEVKEEGHARSSAPATLADRGVPVSSQPLPLVARSFVLRTRLRQYVSLSRVLFLGIVRDVYFYALSAAGLLMVLTNLGSIGSSYGTPVQPATYRVLELMLSSFNLFVIVVAAVYAGDLVWRDREIRAHQVTDSMPVPTSILLMAKLTALAGALAVMLSPLIPLGIAAQTLLGYHHYQIGLYLGTLFGMRLPDFLLIGAFALGVHAIVNNKYLGHLVVIVGLVGIGLSANFDLVQNVLLIFGSHTGQRYSEMLGYGNQLTLFYWLKAYWAGWMLLLLTAAYLLWVRGEETGPRMRLRGVRDRAGRGTAVAALGGSLLAVGAGGFIFYNTHILNPYIPTQEADRRDADYERTYKKYAALAQPQIARTELAVELFPSEQRGAIGGIEQLVNRTHQPVDTLHVFFDPLARVTALAVTGAQPGGVDASQGYHAYVFDPVLAPGDSAVLSYTMEYRHQGFRNNELDFTIRRNGTFLEPYSLGPKIGYDGSRELGGEGARRKNGLPPQEGWPARDSPGATSRPRIGPPGGVEFAATIGTDADQVAIATGDLISSWSRDGRAYFRYEAPQPVPYYGVVSGRWAVSADRWGDIDIYVYYHPTHSRNVGRMIEAVKATLAYGTGRFGPIPFSRVAIVEMPRTLGGTGAQAVAGIIPYGEDAGFSARIRANDIDVPLYLTSHEVAHYWWGYRETPSATRGSAVLSESLAQYTALVVMKHQFDQEHTRRFLRFVLDRYLLGRSREGTGETPLAVTERAYGAYEKGALVMFALQERLGEDRFNSALQGLMDEAVAGSPPYPTTLDLMRHLQEVTPDSLREFLEDAFDRIVLYDNRVASAEATPLDDGRYAVRITLEARKVVADSIGQETEVPMNDPVDLVVYGERRAGGQEPPVLQAGTHRLASGETVVELEVEGKPARVVLDPFCTLVDRRPQDNERSVKLLSAQPARR